MNEPLLTAQVVAREYLLETTAPMLRQAGRHETAAAVENAACSGLPEVVADSIVNVIAGISEPFIATHPHDPRVWRFITVDLGNHLDWWTHGEESVAAEHQIIARGHVADLEDQPRIDGNGETRPPPQPSREAIVRHAEQHPCPETDDDAVIRVCPCGRSHVICCPICEEAVFAIRSEAHDPCEHFAELCPEVGGQ